jgi:hypothetical protein
MAFCSDAGRGDELLRRLARLAISQPNNPQTPQSQALPPLNGQADLSLDSSGQKDVSTLMMSMRKLREGIVASNRIDDFSIQAYIFCIRLSILMKQMEAYHPALLFLLNKMHKVQPLSSVALQEFVGYRVLDLACRDNDLAQAYAVRNAYNLRDVSVDDVLRALAHDNYCLFWKVKKSVDGHKAKLMEYAEERVQKQALKCLGRSYLTIDLSGLEQYTNSSWSTLTNNHSVGWELQGAKVVIRKPKSR